MSARISSGNPPHPYPRSPLADMRRIPVLASFAYIIGTYWTLEVFYSWKIAYGMTLFDVWYSFLAYSGIVAAGVLAFLALTSSAGSR